jgi:hypothetical protein
VSGAFPETERERQLRQLAGRLLTWPDPEGPVSVDLIPVGYPDDLPPELVDLTDLRFLGSAVQRRVGALVSVEMLFEGQGEPRELIADYEASLVRLGWDRLDQPGPMRFGFGAGDFPEISLLVERRKSAVVNLRAMRREDGGSELRVHYDPVHAHETIANLARATHPEASILPPLQPPPGVRLRPEGTGGTGGMWKSDARAQTDMPPMELEAFFAKQLELAGWGRLSGSADEAFAWSSWLVPAVPPSAEWRGILLVLAAFPGWRFVAVRAEMIQPGGHRGAGGYAVSGILSSR